MEATQTPQAGLGWIHFSDTTRRQVLKVIDLLGEPGVIDELGIGVIRNAFSNEMFTGVTTIMTRARYFFLVPYLMIDYLREKQKLPPIKYMNQVEMKLVNDLYQHYGENSEIERVIGYTIAKSNHEKNRHDELVRKPSEIYWGGMREYGIFKKSHSFRQLCDSINKGKYTNKDKDNIGNDNESGDDENDFEKWAELFDVPYYTNWQNQLSLSLTEKEANLLRDKIIYTQKDKLIAELLSNPEWIPEFLEIKGFPELLNSSFYTQLTAENRKVIKTGKQFWDIMEGAHVRFNMLLLQKGRLNTEATFYKTWDVWQDETLSNIDLMDFDISFMWQLVREYSNIKPGTEDFINEWYNALLSNKDTDRLDQLVMQQARYNKKTRSKLEDNHNTVYSEYQGIRALNYRLYPYANTIIKDIAISLGYI